jgi:hypothetical protein
LDHTLSWSKIDFQTQNFTFSINIRVHFAS